ncbi:hypothetical protein HMPREF1871_00646 [Gemelliphila asaccharolytica]|uniref:Flagellin Flp1-like domain-containing protein n=1 Tax=Gemelliphila asaccharolytica TaxID=502393 RepID=A0ABR5TLR0_9BACL|nr:hypothetical protein HMPREF1871_00646 [Gemella asaccharolytica]
MSKRKKDKNHFIVLITLIISLITQIMELIKIIINLIQAFK